MTTLSAAHMSHMLRQNHAAAPLAKERKYDAVRCYYYPRFGKIDEDTVLESRVISRSTNRVSIDIGSIITHASAGSCSFIRKNHICRRTAHSVRNEKGGIRSPGSRSIFRLNAGDGGNPLPAGSTGFVDTPSNDGRDTFEAAESRILPSRPHPQTVNASASSPAHVTEHVRDNDHDHNHDHHHTHSREHTDAHPPAHHPSHSHTHSHHGAEGHSHTHTGHLEFENSNTIQRAILAVASTFRLTLLADALRDSVPMALASLAFCALAYVTPLLLPSQLGTTLHNLFTFAAFPLTGIPALLDASMDLGGGKMNIHVLMALAAFASAFLGNALEGALLLAMFALSHVAEEYFTQKAMGDVNALRENNPETALVVDDFDIDNPPPLSALSHKELPVAEVKVGAYLLVKAGEAVPLDGVVFAGRSLVTVEHLTGETTPLDLHKGDSVAGGARNLDGVLIVRASKDWADSTVARIMQLTQEARENRPQLQRWLDKFGEGYSEGVVALSVAVALAGPLLFGWPLTTTGAVKGSIYRALGLMVAASPCALAVSPLAYATAVSACASKGILLKGGRALDALSVCDTVAFDKTGTLTTGELVCRVIEPLHGHSPPPPGSPLEWKLQSGEEGGGGQYGTTVASCCSPSCQEEALAVAAAMEAAATHPIARAVLEAVEGRSLPAVAVHDWEAVAGQGLAATVTTYEDKEHLMAGKGGGGGVKARMGTVEFVASLAEGEERQAGIHAAALAACKDKELVLAALAVDNKVSLFHFEDELREGAKEVVEELQGAEGLRLLMLTGDREASARRVGEAVGIREVFWGLKPEDKLRHVQRMAEEAARSGRGGLVMVGDGINDAPALAAATVGVVLAERASATAIAAADVLLLRDSIQGVPFVMAKAWQTTSLVKQGVVLAFAAAIVAAVSSLAGFIPLWVTVLLHEGGTLLVCLNSARAFNDPPGRRHDIMYKLARMWERLVRVIGEIVGRKEGGGKKVAYS